MADEDISSGFENWVPEDVLASLGISSVNLGAVGFNTFDYGREDRNGNIGEGEGEDFEEEVDNEIKHEGLDVPFLISERGRRDETVAPKEPPKPGSHGVPTRPRKRRKVIKEPQKPRDIRDVWPDFEKGKILNLAKMLKARIERKPRTVYRPLPIENIEEPVKLASNPPLHPIFPNTIDLHQVSRGVAHVLAEGEEASKPGDPQTAEDMSLRRALKVRRDADPCNVNTDILLNKRSYDLINLSDWESNIVYEPSMANHRQQNIDLQRPINSALESGSWIQSIIWDPKAPFVDFTQLQLEDAEESSNTPAKTAGADAKDRDDPTAKKKKRRVDASQSQTADPTQLLLLQRDKSILKDKFNISNDQAYEITRQRHRVRQTFGQLVVQHAYPAVKLQLPFYKTRLSKAESRSFHRPALQFPVNVELHFSKVRTAKKKKDRSGRRVTVAGGGDPSEALRTTHDLTLRETGPFVLWEYSEEHPPVIPNVGMGSILVNYYRKREENDDFIPNLDFGEPFILEPSDESPFLRFGAVAPGQTIPALYNNLVRAPLFRHKAAPTDFLVMKSTIGGQTKYYIREIKALFVVGQTFPVVEVPGPHSRKITNNLKYRLQYITYRLLRKSVEERLRLPSVLKYFPDQNDLQMRQRLKEFMEYHRTGPHQGYWRLKPNHEVLPDAKILEQITPEQVVLQESMQVGQRHLLDAGYGNAAAEADDGDVSKLDIEQQLAPWITTKNFVNATHAKAMLKLHGPGDPTGRGEAFSFIRVSMKDIFVRAGEDPAEKEAEAEAQRPKSGHRYNVQQQQNIYRSEIERIWKAQYESLIDKVAPELSDEEDHKNANPLDRVKNESEDRDMSPISESRRSPSFSRLNSPARDDGHPQSNKILRIRRKYGEEWRTEIVRDPNVISAYLKRREEKEFESIPLEEIVPTGDPAKDALLRQKLIDQQIKMQKNQERRLQRKNAQIVAIGGSPILLDRAPKPDTTRRCGHCGQIGHMKTNRKCPRWAEFNQPGSAKSPPAGSPPPSSPVDDRRYGGSGLMPPPPVPPSAFGRSGSFSYPPIPSPLATSPPLSAFGAESDVRRSSSLTPSTPVPSGSGAPSKPKIKLSLKPPGSATSPK